MKNARQVQKHLEEFVYHVMLVNIHPKVLVLAHIAQVVVILSQVLNLASVVHLEHTLLLQEVLFVALAKQVITLIHMVLNLAVNVAEELFHCQELLHVQSALLDKLQMKGHHIVMIIKFKYTL